MAIKVANSPTTVWTGEINPASIDGGLQELVSVTMPGAKTDHVFIAKWNAAPTAGLALGVPYCLTDGTVLVPVINNTAGAINNAAVSISIVAL